MSKKALEDTKYEMIKAHVLTPQESPLSPEQQELLDRVVSVTKILDKNPIQKHAVALHTTKYPNISRSQAYEDIRLAMRLFNTMHTFNFDYWHTWLLNDIAGNIQSCRNSRTPNDRRIIAMEHANLIKAIGERPEDLPDLQRNEKHSFYILIQQNNQNIKIDLTELHKLPSAARQEINKALFGGNEITDVEAEEIMNS
jgi:hypothetical protein